MSAINLKFNRPLCGRRAIFILTLPILLVSNALVAQKQDNSVQAVEMESPGIRTDSAPRVAEQNRLIDSLANYVEINRELPYEKIYLHIDRPNYMQGDTVWFKAYSWYGYDQLPDTVSSILYVDLVNPRGAISMSRKLLISDGTSIGEFALDSAITPGVYTLQAYTRWMQNIDCGNPFYQTITINPVNQNFQFEWSPVIVKNMENDSLKIGFRFYEIDRVGNVKGSLTHKINYSLKMGDQVLVKSQVQAGNGEEQFFGYGLEGTRGRDTTVQIEFSIDDNNISFNRQFSVPLIDNIDLQFFPEGGDLIEGIESRVGFKAIGADGLSREVKGVIETGEGDVVVNFESSRKGMGEFRLTPLPGKTYFASIVYDNRNYVIPLPSVLKEGSVISVRYVGTGLDQYVTVKSTSPGTNRLKYLVGSSYGEVRFTALVKFRKDSSMFRIPLEMLPEGICRLTLLGEDFGPECERLIYVDKNQRFKIDITADSTSYGARSKVTLLVKTTGMDGIPVQTDLSVSVVDKEQVLNSRAINEISAFKLLKSEIQGNIEDAGFYFKDDSCVNHEALDLLLLTQGYRKFIPERSKAEDQVFLPETGLDFSGELKINTITGREKKYNYSDVNLTLFYRSSNNPNIAIFNPDSLGRFAFSLPPVLNKSVAFIQASNTKMKRLDALITLDDPVVPPKFIPPVFSETNIVAPAVENIRQLQENRKTEISKDPFYGIKFNDLPEVTVTAKAKNWYRDFENYAEKVVGLDTLDPKGDKFESLSDLLVSNFGAIPHYYGYGKETAFLPSISLSYSYYLPIYVINETVFLHGAESTEGMKALIDYKIPVNETVLDYITNFPVNGIKKIMVIPPGDFSGYYGGGLLFKTDPIWQSVVVMETYSNYYYRGDPIGARTFMLDGLDTPRQFYSPRYEGPQKNNPIYDGRATLYWNPSIKTDSSGQSQIEFFMNDRNTDFEVFVSGIEVLTGNPGEGYGQIRSVLKK